MSTVLSIFLYQVRSRTAKEQNRTSIVKSTQSKKVHECTYIHKEQKQHNSNVTQKLTQIMVT